MSNSREHYGSAGWAVFAIGVLGIIHATLVHYAGIAGGFITPVDETVIGGALLLVGFGMVRHGAGPRE